MARVVVVGGGIGGLAAACELQRIGSDVIVLESADGPEVVGAGITLHPNALRCLPDSAARICGAGAELRGQVLHVAGAPPARIDWSEVWGDMGRPVGLARMALAGILHDRLPRGTVRWGARVVAVDGGPSAAAVRLSDGSRLDADLVVGADGVRSSVRAAVAPDAAVRYLGQVYWRFLLERPADLPPDEWRVWQRGSRLFGVMPLGGDLAHGFLQLHAARPPEPADADDVRRMLRQEVGRVDPALERFVQPSVVRGSIHFGPAMGVHAERWARGRVVLVGDAAHATSPLVSQGAGMALEDAVVLGGCLRRPGPVDEALSAYERRRRPRVAHLLRCCDLQLRILNGGLAGTGTSASLAAPARTSAAVRWVRTVYGPLRSPA